MIYIDFSSLLFNLNVSACSGLYAQCTNRGKRLSSAISRPLLGKLNESGNIIYFSSCILRLEHDSNELLADSELVVTRDE